jgi:hypothetical protein
MPRLTMGFAILLALTGTVSAQDGAMKSSAPEMMTPPGESAPMRACDKMAMEQHIKMEERARFVQDCIAKKMK